MSSTTLDDDAKQVKNLGYKQELKRTHTTWSLFGLAFIVLNTWTALSASFSLALPWGGPSVVLWGLVVSGICNGCLAASMAEFAGLYPTAAGQYYWVAIVSSQEWAPLLSWICGWVNLVGWVFLTGMAASFASTMIEGMAAMMNPTYVNQTWHTFLIYAGIATLVFCVNALGNSQLPLLNKTALVWSLVGFAIITMSALASAAPNYLPASFVFGGVINKSEWPTGLAWTIGLLQGTLSLIGYDAPAHLCEEIINPSKNVPRVMIGSVIIGTISGFCLCMALLFVSPEIESVLAAPEGALLHILTSATGSQQGAITLNTFPTLCLILGTTAIMTTASRLMWAFARDGGLPFSPWLAHVHTGLGIPLNALVVTYVVVLIYGLLFFAGAAALNALVSASIVSLGISYAFPTFVNMCGGRRRLPKNRPFRMPEPVAWVVNFIGVAFVAVTTVLFCLPPGGPTVTKQTMNYTVLALGIVVIIAVGDYFLDGKRRFKGPRLPVFDDEDLERLQDVGVFGGKPSVDVRMA
ncbi:amino acid/polyamine transporter I [Tricharina praecox]|uniref:amino acid/polyamine transporter I n=1 Tax=Tricharina praecox TaxID=43433 RepID=UPI00221FF1FC|nr:amino acid/polyamine transporter I [Tricharina praecox]KAI5857151.1 amino acid/polyamine transporter I [Tricharina praecox]